MRGKSGAFLFNHISDTYRCSPRAHASRVVRTRVLATYVMAEPHALYRMCSKADTYAACETCMDLPITMYLWPSLAAADSPRMVNVFSSLRPAKLRSRRGVWYSAGRVGGRVDRRWSDARAGMRDPRPVASARPGDFCGTIRVPISVWAIRVMSWGQSETCLLSGMALPETK